MSSALLLYSGTSRLGMSRGRIVQTAAAFVLRTCWDMISCRHFRSVIVSTSFRLVTSTQAILWSDNFCPTCSSGVYVKYVWCLCVGCLKVRFVCIYDVCTWWLYAIFKICVRVSLYCSFFDIVVLFGQLLWWVSTTFTRLGLNSVNRFPTVDHGSAVSYNMFCNFS